MRALLPWEQTSPPSLTTPTIHNPPPPPWLGCGKGVGCNRQLTSSSSSPGTRGVRIAGLACDLYRACVVAGQWAKLTVEQRQDGEHFTLLCRPMAASAATTAAAACGPKKRRRKPNLRRRERQRQWRKLSRSSKKDKADQQQQVEQPQQQHEQPPLLQQEQLPQQQQHVQQQYQGSLEQQQQQVTASSSCSPQQQQATASSSFPVQHQATASSSFLTQLEGATADSVATYIAAETREQPQQQQLVTPRETRASKKRKAELSPTATPSTPGGILQMDGASDNTPTGRLLPPLDGANGGLTTTPSRPMAPYHAPPKPPPWSTHLPKHPCKVICYLCCADSHYIHYNQCETCHYRRQNPMKI